MRLLKLTPTNFGKRKLFHFLCIGLFSGESNGASIVFNDEKVLPIYKISPPDSYSLGGLPIRTL